MQYEVKTQTDTIIDGQKVREGETVAVIETNLPIGNVLSGAAFGTFRVSKVEGTENTITPVARQAVGADSPGIVRDEHGNTIADSQSDSDDPDALNDADDEADAAEAARIAAEKAAAEKAAADKAAADAANKPSEVTLDASLAGLNARLATELTAQGLSTRAAISEFVNSGKDLYDLDGVGKKTKADILAWLASDPA